MTTDDNALGEALRKQREAALLTQEEFAAKYHVSTRTVRRIENGRKPSLRVLKLLLKKFPALSSAVETSSAA